MTPSQMLQQIKILKAQTEAQQHTLTVLEKELEGSGASSSSYRKAKLKKAEDKAIEFYEKRKARMLKKK